MSLIDSYWDYVRLFNVLAGTGMLALILRRYLLRRDDVKMRLLRLCLMGLIVSILIPTIDLWARGVSANARILPFSVTIVWLYVTYFWEYLPRNRGKVGQPRI